MAHTPSRNAGQVGQGEGAESREQNQLPLHTGSYAEQVTDSWAGARERKLKA
jgi:hypothetical protein